MNVDHEVLAGVVWRTCPIPRVPSLGTRSWLTQGDLRKGASISHPEARKRFLVARALLRRTIAEARPDLGWTAVEIRSAASGRPTAVTDSLHGLGSVHGAALDPTFVPDHLDLYLSVSHTRGLAAVAVSTDAPVGIDVEPLGRGDLPKEEAWLTPEERERLTGSTRSQRLAQLLRLWVAKEAALKASDAMGARLHRELSISESGEVGGVSGPDAPDRPVIGRVGWHEVDHRFLVAVSAYTAGR
jgi:phosphopantetheinyl transferase